MSAGLTLVKTEPKDNFDEEMDNQLTGGSKQPMPVMPIGIKEEFPVSSVKQEVLPYPEENIVYLCDPDEPKKKKARQEPVVTCIKQEVCSDNEENDQVDSQACNNCEDQDFYITNSEDGKQPQPIELNTNIPEVAQSLNEDEKEESFVLTGKAIVQVPLFYKDGKQQGRRSRGKSESNVVASAAIGAPQEELLDGDKEEGPVPQHLVEVIPGQTKLPLDMRRIHTCPQCDRKFTRKASLARHMMTHSGVKPFKCLECGKEFRQKGNLTLHEFIHTGAKPYKCVKCDLSFVTKTKLAIHESIHKDDTPFACLECGKCFKRAEDLRKHVLIHGGEKNFVCDLCGKTFLRKSQLKAHKRRHLESRSGMPYGCDECGRVFLLALDMKNHECTPIVKAEMAEKLDAKDLGNHSEGAASRMFQSKTLEKIAENFMKNEQVKVFEQNSSVEEVNDSESAGEPSAEYSSPIVVENNGTRNSVDSIDNKERNDKIETDFASAEHDSGLVEIGEDLPDSDDEIVDDSMDQTFEKNESEKTIECQICGRQFVHAETLNKHMLIHTEEKLHKCDLCDEAFLHFHSLRDHKIAHALVSDGKPYKCTFCDKEFKHASFLKRHETIHTGVRPFICEVCGKDFRTKWHLHSHTTSHTGIKPFHCEICNHAFAHQSDVRAHMIVHTGEKRFTCEQCGQKFKTSSHYWQHMRRHSGDKPHKCVFEDCDRAFTTTFELQRHIQVHTGEKPWACGVCGKAFIDKCVMVRHEKTHSGQKRYKCNSCESSYNTKKALQEHELEHENGVAKPKKPLKCGLCGIIFETNELLSEHKVFHTPLPYRPPNLKCERCEDTFTSEADLKSHEVIHSLNLEESSNAFYEKVSGDELSEEHEEAILKY